MVDGAMTRDRPTVELSTAGAIAGAFAAGTNRLLEAKEQTVQIHGRDLCGVDGTQRVRIAQPARAEIPAALGRRADVPVQLPGIAPAALGQAHILAPGFIAWRIDIVPIAIEDGAIRQPHHAAYRAGSLQRTLTSHPESVF